MRLRLPLIDTSAAESRQRAWLRATDLNKEQPCPWALERLKISTDLEKNSDQLLHNQRGRCRSWAAGLQLAVAGFLALCIWIVYVARHRAGSRQVSLKRDVRCVLALHAEDTTRTRHVIEALAATDSSIAGIILLGRIRFSPQEVRSLWSKKDHRAILYDLPLLIPMSPSACLYALANLPRQMMDGIRVAASDSMAISVRRDVTIVFRIMLGLTAAHWWRLNGKGQEVLFGHTGTADTILLECEIQRSGARTIHLVHGQATGPNFLGFSDVALFRSRHDADAYAALDCYKECSIQPAAQPYPKRGASGCLLLSNLAHPMNAGFRKSGIKDELNLLYTVADVARSLGPIATPLLWKPHPVIMTLPTQDQEQLRSTAKALGFVELDANSDIKLAAASCHWVVSSPSTVAIDLLRSGMLCVMLDPQGTLPDSALECLPTAFTSKVELIKILISLSRPEEYYSKFLVAWEKIGPAGPLDLNVR